MTADPVVQTKIVKLSKRWPGEILVGMNIRDRRYRDIYRIDLATGQRTEVFRNERNNIDVVADPDFNIRLAISGNADRSEEHTSELQSLMRISYVVFCLKTKRYVHSHSMRL